MLNEDAPLELWDCKAEGDYPAQQMLLLDPGTLPISLPPTTPPPQRQDKTYFGTTVTAYFKFAAAKHTSDEYSTWMKNFMWVNTPLVVFTTPDVVPMFQQLRQHRPTVYYTYPSVHTGAQLDDKYILGRSV